MPPPIFSGTAVGGNVEIHRLHLAEVILPDTSPQPGDLCPVFAYAVRHAAGLLLFDTGLGELHPVIENIYQPQTNPLSAALESIGALISDVTAVVNSHLHFDHCGGNPSFPGIPIFVQASEYEASRDPTYTIPDRVDFAAADLRPLDGESIVAPGLTVVPTPGHTPGHQSLVIAADGGPIILAGQAAYTAREFDDSDNSDPAGIESAWDRDLCLQSIHALRDYEPALVLFSHDDSVWRP
ncbi:MAG: N-acyl homoserine lactonase family protein [Chloroflexi bacterium]|nr:N-acyl homoserine lactonase family protein [Chloroflexota bacterium]